MDPLTVLYDEDCGLCRVSAGALRRWDRGGSLRFAGIRSAEGTRALAAIDPEVRMRSWHISAADGTTWSAGAAIPVLARRLRGGQAVARLAERFPGTTDRLYRWVAAHRLQIGRLLGEQVCATDPSASR